MDPQDTVALDRYTWAEREMTFEKVHRKPTELPEKSHFALRSFPAAFPAFAWPSML